MYFYRLQCGQETLADGMKMFMFIHSWTPNKYINH